MRPPPAASHGHTRPPRLALILRFVCGFGAITPETAAGAAAHPASAQFGQHALAEPVRLLKVRVADRMNSEMPSDAYSSIRSATCSWLPTSAVPAPPRTSGTFRVSWLADLPPFGRLFQKRPLTSAFTKLRGSRLVSMW